MKAKQLKDRHKPRKPISIPPGLYEQLQALAQKNDRPVTREVRRAIVSYLLSQGITPVL